MLIRGIKFGYEGFLCQILARVIQTAECKNEDCLYHECKIWQREHE